MRWIVKEYQLELEDSKHFPNAKKYQVQPLPPSDDLRAAAETKSATVPMSARARLSMQPSGSVPEAEQNEV